ncbi:MAG: hypothetical protein WBD55_07225, partial [Dehalococcoidia bacterium]
MRRVSILLFVAGLALALAAAVAQQSQAIFSDQAQVSSNAFTTAATFPGWLETGSYTGNGVDNRSITGVSFQADVVIVKSNVGQAAVIRTSTMAGDVSKVVTLGGALLADEIQSINSNGFTIGTSSRVNANGQTFYWVAMKAGSNMKVGSYVGNATDNHSITGVGFQPTWVITLGDGEESWFKPSGLAGDASFRMDGTSTFTDRIQAVESGGFQVGANTNVNKASTTFHYIAWKADTNVKESTYTGNNTDDRSITGVGFQPVLVWVKRDSGNQSAWRPASTSGQTSLLWDTTVAATNDIQALETDGFQVGNNARTNTTGTYHY